MHSHVTTKITGYINIFLHAHLLCKLFVTAALTVNVMKNVEISSIVVQWNTLDYFLSNT